MSSQPKISASASTISRISSGRLNERRALWLAVGGVLAVVVLAALPNVLSDYQLLIGYQMLQLAALGQAWNLLGGYGGLASLAVAAFVGVGSYAAAKLAATAGLTLLPATVLGGVAGVIFALIVSVAMFRFRGLYFAIGTLVLAEALLVFMLTWNGLGGSSGIVVGGFAPSLSTLYFFALGLAVLATLITVVILRLRLGFGLRAIRDNEDVAQEMGVSTFRTKLLAFLVSAFIIGAIGAVQAFNLGKVEPTGAFSLNWTINTINAVIIGGIGTIIGPLLGAVFTVELANQLADYPEVHTAIIGALLIIIIRFAPFGLWGIVRRIWSRLPSARRKDAASAEAASPPQPEASSPGAARPGPRAAAPGLDADLLLDARGVTKSFGGVHAVSGVDLTVREGEVLGIIGPNGAGKSTLIGLLAGALTADEGTVMIAGADVTRLSADARARLGVGRTHQIPQPFAQLTVSENLLVAELHGGRGTAADSRAKVADILELTGLSEFADTPASELGLLRLKRLELARALALGPKLLLLDEIGAGLVESEVEQLIQLIESLRGEIQSIVIVEHILDVIRRCCDRVVVLDGGRNLTEGTPNDVLASEKVAAVYLGTAAEHDDGEEATAPAPARPAAGERSELLVLRDVGASYGHFRAIHSVSLEVGEGEVVGLLGTNGAGKTTTARAICGQVGLVAGEIRFAGRRIDGTPTHEVARLGVGHCMEGRRIFGDLSVRENLELAGRVVGGAERRRQLESVYELFSVLAEKRDQPGKQLSGGQQQMLAIGRALMAQPRLIIFDEISLGLAPVAVDRLYEALEDVRQRGVSMLIIEQNVERGLALADRVYVMEKGRTALSGRPSDLKGSDHLRSLYVGDPEAAV